MLVKIIKGVRDKITSTEVLSYTTSFKETENYIYVEGPEYRQEDRKRKSMKYIERERVKIQTLSITVFKPGAKYNTLA